jgi:hypothetical protein
MITLIVSVDRVALDVAGLFVVVPADILRYIFQPGGNGGLDVG